MRTTTVILASAWLGVAAGLSEIALLFVAEHWMGRLVHSNPQNIWMAPLAYAALFTAISIVLSLSLFKRPALAHRLAVGQALFLGSLGALFLVQSLHSGAATLVALGFALQGSSLLLRWRIFPRIVWLTAAPLLLVALALGIGLNAARALDERRAMEAINARPKPAESPNVLLAVWDTVRAPNLSVYGYERATTPTLERLVERGVLFERATSPAPWTLTSHASMFTGALPREMTADWWRALDQDLPTLAELFSQHGYRTGGFVANVLWAGRDVDLDRGFARFEDYPIFSPGYFISSASLLKVWLNSNIVRRTLGLHETLGRKSAEQVNDDLLDWLDDNAERPYFAFLNYFDAHSPYLPPPPYDAAFAPRPNDRWPYKTEGDALTPSQLQAEIDAYDGAIAYVDDRFGRLLHELERRGQLRNTLVIVTSDHGEEFGEHGVFRHGNSLYDRSLHVPLLMSLAGRIPEGRRISTWVSTRDIGATVQQMAGLLNGPTLAGSTLERFWRANGDTSPPQPIVASVSEATGHPAWYPVAKGDMVASMDEPLKYIVSGDDAEEVYDLRADPGELHNLASTTPVDTMTRLRAAARAR